VTEPDGDYEEYVASRMARLRRTAYLVCGDWHHAEDVLATVLAKLYVRWDRIRRSDSVDAYVRRMLVRAVVDEGRRPWRRERPAAYPVLDAVVPAATPEDRLVLVAALAQMPARRRAVLVLRFYEQLSVAETAEALGISDGTVKSQCARGLAALRDALPQEYAEERGQ
jgi:RNA polymerase sigma-70 factor (sigma-E family)